ncbi:head-tail connector protein [Novosphingobium sp. AP12]|uniref:head-tail connector protein n=1 Tax=Novosphingobium sp. AP12 TaxID=1144305 RepID=UPI00027205E9|nr:head-tail connector protein [Novosphingobium sp. AP12]EJL23973.1 Phage QLRG family, putative DNA packaging [Novosphingobium sp. AP12]
MTLPVSRDEAKAQLRVDGNDQDTEIDDLIRDAAAWVEDYTGQILEARDVVEHFTGFRPISLRAWPIDPAAVATVEYVAGAGPALAVGSRLDATRRPARVSPALGSFWPFIDSRQSFTVSVRAGYEDPDDVPRGMCRAMLVMIAAFDADREGGETFAKAEAAAKRLCRRYKRYSL